MHPSNRIAVVQFDPQLGKVRENISKVEALTAQLQPGSVDLLCFPEMAFTGYCFASFSDIRPFLEDSIDGETSRFCCSIAKRLRCHVICGYPEKLSGYSESRQSDDLAANSAILISPEGKLLSNYRKSNLFEFDKPWAEAGNGFTTLDLPAPLGRTVIAICMDLNPFPPAEWTSSGGPFEVAEHIRGTNADTLIFLCNWLDSGEDPDCEWDTRTLQYWVARLKPLWDEEYDTDLSTDRVRTVIICNRTGLEQGVLFAGTSVVFRMSRRDGPEIVGMMKRKTEGARIWTT
ncbi:hydrolase [Cantharellus anzutake]|uniref:hydrolase n=1 Tax=Cantharellus anzutake TaxID=1750568 RepID=UPI001906C3EF|nr:hydrolase [Cantharellus anzutake]KAF8327026.1 hydrolase [Cantharellus anzutake]